MKGTKIFLALILAITVTTIGCKKDDPYVAPTNTGTVNLNITTEVGGTAVVLNNIYSDVKGYRYMPTLFKLYLSNISFIKDDGSEVFVKDAELLDLGNSLNGEAETRTYDLVLGDYTGIRFWLGVDSTMNATDPASYPSTDPLSLYTGTYWDWNTGYRFLMFEGVYDTVPNGTGALYNGNSFTYHTGTNALYIEADLSNAQQTFSLIEDGDSYNYNLALDMNKILYSSSDTIAIKDNRVTHTTNNMPLAEKITNNLSQVFSNKN